VRPAHLTLGFALRDMLVNRTLTSTSLHKSEPDTTSYCPQKQEVFIRFRRKYRAFGVGLEVVRSSWSARFPWSQRSGVSESTPDKSAIASDKVNLTVDTGNRTGGKGQASNVISRGVFFDCGLSTLWACISGCIFCERRSQFRCFFVWALSPVVAQRHIHWWCIAASFG